MYISLNDVKYIMDFQKTAALYTKDYKFYYLLDFLWLMNFPSPLMKKTNEGRYELATLKEDGLHFRTEWILLKFSSSNSLENDIESAYVDSITGICFRVAEVEQDPNFIPIPTKDERKIEKAFLEHINDAEFLQDYNEGGKLFDMHDELNDRGYYSDYVDFSGLEIDKIARAWCEENNIKYKQ